MAYKKWILRSLRVAGLAALALVLLASIVVQFEQRLLRYRAERLMADMHQIRLYQSTWADAQKLMQRWGAWGHYDGTCTAKDCRYEIQLTDASERSYHHVSPNTREWLIRLKAYSLYRWLGGRYSIIDFKFVVQDETILRTAVLVTLDASPRLLVFDDYGYVLIVGARSQQALHGYEHGPSVEGSNDQLAQHPYFKVGGPICEGCLMVGITYSPHTPQPEIERLTSFDMSCLTRFFSCKIPENLLPPAKEWRIYREMQEGIDQ